MKNTGLKSMSVSLRFTLSAAFIFLAAIASLNVGTSAYYLTKNTFRTQLRERLRNVSETAAVLIDGDRHAQLLTPENETSETYKQIKLTLQKIRNANPDIRYVYTMRREGEKFYFVVDAEEDPAKTSHIADEYPDVTPTMNFSYEKGGQTKVEDDFSKDNWGTWISAFAPIKTSDGHQVGIVGVDMAAEQVLKAEHQLRLLIFLGGLATLIFSLLLAYWMATRISKSLSWLVGEVEKVQQLDLSDSVRIHSTISEIREIGGAVEAMKSGLRSFKKYVPSDVVMDLLKLRKEAILNTEKRQLTIFFSDIADFTSISEKLSSERLSQNLGDYLGRVSAIIRSHEGTVDKFIGDAVMAFWGAPNEQNDHALRACRAALACQQEIHAINAELHAKGDPIFATRIGINSGDVLVGNIGHEDRLSYTAIGDAVNTASRIEAINKIYGTEILISGATWNLVQEHFEARIVDSVVAKGKSQAILIYELLSRKEDMTESDRHFVQNSNRGMDSYFAQKYEEASLAFKEVLLQRPSDPLALKMQERIAKALAQPEGTTLPVFYLRGK